MAIIGNNIVTASVSKTDVDNFNQTIDQLCNDITKNVTEYRAFQPVENRIKKALKENVFGFHNHKGYQEVKEVLKSAGTIAESSVLQVTGQLIEDYGWSLMDVSPNMIMSGFGFANTFRTRPTIDSMYAAVHDSKKSLKTESFRSSDVANALEEGTALVPGKPDTMRTSFPITQNIYDAYSEDMAQRVLTLVGKAFDKHAGRTR